MSKSKHSPSIVILTGAGISAESGLDTFRGASADGGGVWSKYRLEEVATPEAFASDPEFVHGFYNARRAALIDVKPNAAHKALARLEADWAGTMTIVTQNVDDLHERGGSKAIIHMHGELRSAWCKACDARFAWLEELSVDSVCTRCNSTGSVRPDVVWFGEMPYQMHQIYELLEGCDVFAAIGTSGNVYPAAQFVQHAAQYGAETFELNLEPTDLARAFHRNSYGKASEIVPDWVERLLRD
ncbi:MAG: NAD-dependent deacylase [Rhizobiaceae bacterium]